MNRILVPALIALALAAGCAPPPPKSESERTVTDTARGVRYIIPQGWKGTEGEVRSPAGTLLTLRVYDLVEADKRFVAGLPDSLIPQLLEWAKFYYIVEGPPVPDRNERGGDPRHRIRLPDPCPPEGSALARRLLGRQAADSAVRAARGLPCRRPRSG
jgi:hypothetical protein